MKHIKNLWRTTDKKRTELWMITILLTVFIVNILNKLMTYYMNKIIVDPVFTNQYNVGPLIFIIIPLIFILSMFILQVSDKLDAKTNYIDKILKSSNFLLKILILIMKGVWWIIKTLCYVILAIIWFFNTVKRFGEPNTSGVGSTRYSTDYESERLRNKATAEYNARKKREEADYAIKQAIKQGKYNSNTIYYDNKASKAIEAQKAADKAQEDLKKYR